MQEGNGLSDEKQVELAESDTGPAWNVNLLCMVGASIGLLAVFVAWMNEPPGIPGPPDIRWEPSIAYMLANHYLYFGASAAFLVGTIVAFASPIGGILQSASLAAFAIGIVESGSDPWLDGIDPQQTLRVGMYLGIASCTLVLTSLFSPLGTGKLRPGKSRKIGLTERLLTVTPLVVEKRP